MSTRARPLGDLWQRWQEHLRILRLPEPTVDYRIQRILSVLDVGADDSDTRLMLQLACRARMLG